MCHLVNDVDMYVNMFREPMENNEYGRGFSWDYCYLFFRNYIELGNEEKQRHVELACMYLGFYLSSWGMYRGSSLVLQKSCKIYKKVIEVLLEEKFRELWKVNFLNLFENIEEIKIFVEKIFCLKEKIGQSFNDVNNERNVTDTLVTKIILGTMGCVPAYDNNFRIGLKERDVRPRSAFSENSFREVLKFCKVNFTSIDNIQIPVTSWDDIRNEHNYPFMKKADMYFWQIGYERVRANQ